MTSPLVSIVIVSRNRKKDLINCIKSLFLSSYNNCEIILVDNFSEEKIDLSWWKKKAFPMKLVYSSINTGAAEGRNIGINNSRGKYILFVDDDAIADEKMIEKMIYVFCHNKLCGIVQPLIFDMDNNKILQGAGHDINLTNGRITAWGAGEEDKGQYNGLREVPMCGCIWMVSRRVVTLLHGYDPDYFIPYEDSDFSIRARKKGFQLFCFSEAKAWHQGKKKTYVSSLVDYIGITSPERAFRVARNKLIFMRKHAGLRFIPFFFFILPIYLVLHTIIIVLSKRFDILVLYWKGLFSGIYYVIKFPFSKNVFV